MAKSKSKSKSKSIVDTTPVQAIPVQVVELQPKKFAYRPVRTNHDVPGRNKGVVQFTSSVQASVAHSVKSADKVPVYMELFAVKFTDLQLLTAFVYSGVMSEPEYFVKVGKNTAINVLTNAKIVLKKGVEVTPCNSRIVFDSWASLFQPEGSDVQV